MSQIMFELRLDEEAAAWLKTILKFDSRHIPAMLSLAKFYHKQGRADLANDYIEMARQVQERSRKMPPSAPAESPPLQSEGNPK